MSIFVALIFQILFVFFAMTINIGLLIHDKINLQNSADLAAYYGAQRMAEVMNVMSHINYQIRQDYKLMAYRLRVLGGMGYNTHPSRSNILDDVAYFDQDIREYAPVCLTWRGWEESADENQNICQSANHEIRELPPVPIVADFIPINTEVSGFVDNVRQQILDVCQRQKEYNWQYAATIFHMYRQKMVRRKQAFRALAQNLSQSPNQMLDIDAQSIRAGVERTLENNLTSANFDGGLQIEHLNGLQDPAISGLPAWLSEILITPQIFYIYHDGILGACTNEVRNIRLTEGLVAADPDLQESVQGEPGTAEFHSSLGFEKNPWFMAYYGVKVTTSPRKPFAPFGTPVQMVARAFAKPFGGRMGPWFKRNWTRGQALSGVGEPEVDPMLVPRVAAPQNLDIGLAEAPRHVPNFSRFPGDTLGLKSNLSMAHTPSYNGQANVFSLVQDFAHVANILEPDGDPLAYRPEQINSEATPGGAARTMELAAVAPDLFDITYYSIEANFNNNYAERDIWNRLNVQFPRDMGSVPGQTPQNVQNQVAHANALGRRNVGGVQYYKITDPSHLLTAWHQRGESDYTLDPERFGRCSFRVPEGADIPPYPSQCLVGGRSGYSVKLISKSYLNFTGHEVGGAGEGAGPLLNPPPESF